MLKAHLEKHRLVLKFTFTDNEIICEKNTGNNIVVTNYELYSFLDVQL